MKYTYNTFTLNKLFYKSVLLLIFCLGYLYSHSQLVHRIPAPTPYVSKLISDRYFANQGNASGQINRSCSLANPTITAQSDTSFCAGDSVILIASDTGNTGKTLDQSQLVYTGGTSARTLAGYSEWQSFTTGITGTLSEIDMGFFNAINGSGTLNVFSGQGTTGTLLQTETVNVVCVSGNCMIPFAVNIAVTAGQIYTFQFIPGSGIPDPYGVQVSMSNTYAGGEMGLVDPSGTSYPGFDLVFETFVSATASLRYHWSDGATSVRTVAYTTGIYTVTVSDTSSGCTATSSINVTAYLRPTAYLPHDTSVRRGNPISPQTNGGPFHYLWSNGDTASAIVIDSTGKRWVSITDTQGCSVTDTSMVHILTTAIAETGATQLNIRVYPNPVKDQIIIEMPDMSPAYSISLFDVLGRTILHIDGNIGTIKIPASTLDKGEYIVEIFMNTVSYRYKLSKY